MKKRRVKKTKKKKQNGKTKFSTPSIGLWKRSKGLSR